MLRHTNTGSSSGDAAESIRRESHNPLVRKLDKDRSPLSLEAMLRERSRRYDGIMFLDQHLQAPPSQ